MTGCSRLAFVFGAPVLNTLFLVSIDFTPGWLLSAACRKQYRGRSQQRQRNSP